MRILSSIFHTNYYITLGLPVGESGMSSPNGETYAVGRAISCRSFVGGSEMTANSGNTRRRRRRRRRRSRTTRRTRRKGRRIFLKLINDS